MDFDGIPIEMIKALGEEAKDKLGQICQQIYTFGEWPVHFMQSILVPLPKNAQECNDPCTISWIAHASKVLLKISTQEIRI